jgi:hypothetical protein
MQDRRLLWIVAVSRALYVLSSGVQKIQELGMRKVRNVVEKEKTPN